MSQKTLLAEVIEELEKAILVAKRMEDAGKQPAVEIAILLDKLKHCYEMVLFSNIKSDSVIAEKHQAEEVIPDKVIEQKETIEVKPVPITEPHKPVEVITPEPNVIEVHESKPIEHEEKRVVDELKPIADILTAKTVKKHETLGEKHLSGRRFLNDYLAENKDRKDFSSLEQTKPIKDLTKAFRLNDQFLFTKELFNNDSAHFQSTIHTLNEMESLEDALMHIGANFEWKADEPTVVQFIDILQRRFM